MTDADDLKQMYSQAIAERQRQQDAHGNALIDAAIEAGLLPKTDVLTPEIAYYLAKSEEIRQNNLDKGINGLSLPDLELAWEWAQVRYQRFLAEQARRDIPSPEAVPNFPASGRKTRKNKGGRKRLQAHGDALQRLKGGQPRQMNFAQWRTEYEKETGIDPEQTASGAWELHRSMVWRKYSSDETPKSTG